MKQTPSQELLTELLYHFLTTKKSCNEFIDDNVTKELRGAVKRALSLLEPDATKTIQQLKGEFFHNLRSVI